MLLANATSQPTKWDKTLWIPGGTLLLCVLIAFVVVRTRGGQIDGWLSKSRSRRRFFGWIAPVGLLAFALLIDRGAIAAAMNGVELSNWDRLSFTLAAVIGVFSVTTAYLVLGHEDRWNERVEGLEGKLVEEQAENEKLTRSFRFALKMCKTFLGIVGHKAERLRDFVEHSADALTVPKLRDVLKPTEQLLKIVIATHEIYRERLNGEGTLRVAYFQRQGEYLQLAHCWNGDSDRCIKSPNYKHKEKFRLDGSACFAVWLSQRGGIIVVPDAEAAHNDQSHPFKYFYPDQRKKIGSLVGIALIREGEDPPFEHIMVIDTSRKGFFTESEEDKLELELLEENVRQRLRLEADLKRIFKAPKEGSRS